MSNIFVDFTNGNNLNSGADFTNRKQTLASAGGVASPGDTIRIMKSSDVFSLGVSGTWTEGSATVTLSSPLTKTITDCETNWTDDGVFTTASSSTSSYRQGSKSQKILCVFPPTVTASLTGSASFNLASTQDFSSYQKITLWARSTGSSVNSNITTINLSLCSGAGGGSPVNTFNFLGPEGAFNVDKWSPIVFDNGSALDSGINSISIVITITQTAGAISGNFTFYLDNIEACNNFTLASLIGKNTGTETFYGVRSILGTTVILDTNPAISPATNMLGYAGTTETVTTYRRETIKSEAQTFSTSGSAGSPITISGGWNTTDMSTQTGSTWLDGPTGTGVGFSLSGNYITVDNDTLAAVRWNEGFQLSGNNFAGTILAGNNCNDVGVFGTGWLNPNIAISACAANTYGFYSTDVTNFTIGNIYNCWSNATKGITLNAARQVKSESTWDVRRNNFSIDLAAGGQLGDIITTNNNDHGAVLSNKDLLKIKSFTSTGNTGKAVLLNSGAPVKFYNFTSSGNTADIGVYVQPVSVSQIEHVVYNANISETVESSGFSTFRSMRTKFQNRGGVYNDNIIYTDGGTITLNTTGGFSSPIRQIVAITGSYRDSMYPIEVSLAKIAVANTGTVTFNAYFRLSHATNISAQLVCLGGQVNGLTTDQIDTASGTSYVQLTVSFTPTAKGVVEFLARVWSDTGSTSNTVDISDYSFDQA